MVDMQWWAEVVAQLGDDALEQVASGLGTGPILRRTSPVTEGDKLLNNMHDMAVHELADRSRVELAKEMQGRDPNGYPKGMTEQ